MVYNKLDLYATRFCIVTSIGYALSLTHIKFKSDVTNIHGVMDNNNLRNPFQLNELESMNQHTMYINITQRYDTWCKIMGF